MHPLQQRMIRRIKQVRTDRGLTQGALAQRAGLARGYLNRVESGRSDPSLCTLIKLARALKVTVGALVE